MKPPIFHLFLRKPSPRAVRDGKQRKTTGKISGGWRFETIHYEIARLIQDIQSSSNHIYQGLEMFNVHSDA